MATVERILETADGFYLYTDHHNLIFLFDPLAVLSDLSQSYLREVLRWAVSLSSYNYTCVHIKGTYNISADLVSLWTVSDVVCRVFNVLVLPSSSAIKF